MGNEISESLTKSAAVLVNISKNCMRPQGLWLMAVVGPTGCVAPPSYLDRWSNLFCTRHQFNNTDVEIWSVCVDITYQPVCCVARFWRQLLSEGCLEPCLLERESRSTRSSSVLATGELMPAQLHIGVILCEINQIMTKCSWPPLILMKFRGWTYTCTDICICQISEFWVK